MEYSTNTSGSRQRQPFKIPYAHLPHGLVTFPRRILPWIEPWFLAYACLGVVQGGMLMVLSPLLCMPMVLGLPLKAVLAGVLGLGFAAANTVANMFIVEVRPREEWDARIGALQALGG